MSTRAVYIVGPAAKGSNSFVPRRYYKKWKARRMRFNFILACFNCRLRCGAWTIAAEYKIVLMHYVKGKRGDRAHAAAHFAKSLLISQRRPWHLWVPFNSSLRHLAPDLEIVDAVFNELVDLRIAEQLLITLRDLGRLNLRWTMLIWDWLDQ